MRNHETALRIGLFSPSLFRRGAGRSAALFAYILLLIALSGGAVVLGAEATVTKPAERENAPAAEAPRDEAAQPSETTSDKEKTDAPAADAPAPTAAAPAVAAPPGENTPEQRAEAERKEKREQERQELMLQAEAFIQNADMTILYSLPYPLNFLFTARIFSIPLWRFIGGACLSIVLFFLMLLACRQINKSRTRVANANEPGRLPLGMAVALLALRNPVKIFVLAIIIRSVSSILVTSYHPDFVWFSKLLVVVAVAVYFFDLVGIIDKVYGDRIFRSEDRVMDTVRPILLKTVRAIILAVLALHIYQSATGQTMFSLLAGLGIGGLALALASQETLKNLLGFASIAMDKSFLVGDPVSIASVEGTVEHVGLRSTLVRTYDGKRVIIPNSAAINSNVINYNRRPYIRREIRIALNPANPYEKVAAAMDAIREVVEGHDGKIAGLPPVVRFVDFEPARFIIQALFWYDAGKLFYYDESSRINLEICRRLSELGVKYSEW